MMTKGELRKARKLAASSGQKLTGELVIRKNPVASNRTTNRKNSRKRAAVRKANSNE